MWKSPIKPDGNDCFGVPKRENVRNSEYWKIPEILENVCKTLENLSRWICHLQKSLNLKNLYTLVLGPSDLFVDFLFLGTDIAAPPPPCGFIPPQRFLFWESATPNASKAKETFGFLCKCYIQTD